MVDHTPGADTTSCDRVRRRRRRCVAGRSWALGRMIDVLTSWTSWTTSHNASRSRRQTLFVDVDYGRKATSHKRLEQQSAKRLAGACFRGGALARRQAPPSPTRSRPRDGPGTRSNRAGGGIWRLEKWWEAEATPPSLALLGRLVKADENHLPTVLDRQKEPCRPGGRADPRRRQPRLPADGAYRKQNDPIAAGRKRPEQDADMALPGVMLAERDRANPPDPAGALGVRVTRVRVDLRKEGMRRVKRAADRDAIVGDACRGDTSAPVSRVIGDRCGRHRRGRTQRYAASHRRTPWS